jgi:hypothetical protein
LARKINPEISNHSTDAGFSPQGCVMIDPLLTLRGTRRLFDLIV